MHDGHLGVESCLRRAREVVYWPLLNSEIKDYVSNCSVCNTLQPSQTREPLAVHEIPERPWSRVATDLFSFNGDNFLVIVDYFSNYIEMEKLRSQMSPAVINVLKQYSLGMEYWTQWYLIMAQPIPLRNSANLQQHGNSTMSQHILTTHNPMARRRVQLKHARPG